MRKLLLLVLLFSSTALFAQNTSQLVGTWHLVSGIGHWNDSTYNYTSPQFESIKIVTPTHFAVFAKKGDNIFEHALAGTVKMDGATYTASIQYGNSADIIGQMAAFTYKMENGR